MPSYSASIVHCWFKIWDTYNVNDHPGIRLSELRDRLLRSREAENYPDEVVTKLLTVADTDNDGYISFSEFVNLVSN